MRLPSAADIDFGVVVGLAKPGRLFGTRLLPVCLNQVEVSRRLYTFHETQRR